jgi:hypothetical protein
MSLSKKINQGNYCKNGQDNNLSSIYLILLPMKKDIFPQIEKLKSFNKYQTIYQLKHLNNVKNIVYI